MPANEQDLVANTIYSSLWSGRDRTRLQRISHHPSLQSPTMVSQCRLPGTGSVVTVYPQDIQQALQDDTHSPDDGVDDRSFRDVDDRRREFPLLAIYLVHLHILWLSACALRAVFVVYASGLPSWLTRPCSIYAPGSWFSCHFMVYAHITCVPFNPPHDSGLHTHSRSMYLILESPCPTTLHQHVSTVSQYHYTSIPCAEQSQVSISLL